MIPCLKKKIFSDGTLPSECYPALSRRFLFRRGVDYGMIPCLKKKIPFPTGLCPFGLPHLQGLRPRRTLPKGLRARGHRGIGLPWFSTIVYPATVPLDDLGFNPVCGFGLVSRGPVFRLEMLPSDGTLHSGKRFLSDGALPLRASPPARAPPSQDTPKGPAGPGTPRHWIALDLYDRLSRDCAS